MAEPAKLPNQTPATGLHKNLKHEELLQRLSKSPVLQTHSRLGLLLHNCDEHDIIPTALIIVLPLGPNLAARRTFANHLRTIRGVGRPVHVFAVVVRGFTWVAAREDAREQRSEDRSKRRQAAADDADAGFNG